MDGCVDDSEAVEAKKDEVQEKKEEAVADAETEDDSETDTKEADPLALDEEFATAKPEIAAKYAEQLDLLRANVEAMAPMLALEQQLTDKEKAPAALKQFAEAIATHHGLDLATVFGLTSKTTNEPPAWQVAGYDSEEAYNADPEWQRAGYDSPNEYKLAKELADLRAMMTPTLEAQKASKEADEAAAAKSRFEAAVTAEAPKAIAALTAEHGWKVTPAMALEAATKFPQLAATSLKEAILAAFPVELAKHYGSGPKKTEKTVPDMPMGGDSRGVRVPDPDNSSIADLAEFAYSQL